MSVTAVPTAAEGLSALQREAPPDIIVSDLAMPGQDGFELIRRIRQQQAEWGRTIPAIALSAYARPEERARALASGYQLHLPKPFETAELLNAIARLAGKSRNN